jgi:transcriptional regulator with AAA-type ATPase domain
MYPFSLLTIGNVEENKRTCAALLLAGDTGFMRPAHAVLLHGHAARTAWFLVCNCAHLNIERCLFF